jgi:hypothetical protein
MNGVPVRVQALAAEVPAASQSCFPANCALVAAEPFGPVSISSRIQVVGIVGISGVSLRSPAGRCGWVSRSGSPRCSGSAGKVEPELWACVQGFAQHPRYGFVDLEPVVDERAVTRSAGTSTSWSGVRPKGTRNFFSRFPRGGWTGLGRGPYRDTICQGHVASWRKNRGAVSVRE